MKAPAVNMNMVSTTAKVERSLKNSDVFLVVCNTIKDSMFPMRPKPPMMHTRIPLLQNWTSSNTTSFCLGGWPQIATNSSSVSLITLLTFAVKFMLRATRSIHLKFGKILVLVLTVEKASLPLTFIKRERPHFPFFCALFYRIFSAL